MKALAIPALGQAPAMLHVPVDEPAEGEVRVAVDVASVNGFDIMVAAGYVWESMPHTFPVVLGRDFVGTVDAVGPGVDAVRVGERVAGVVVAPGGLGPGAIGEYVVTGASGLVPLPDGLDGTDAAAVGLAGVAALDAVDALAPGAGDTVLVSGATGGVGSIAVQIAAERGASVLATARPGEEADFVRSVGAAAAVDYSEDLAAAVREEAPDGVTAVLHAAGDPVALAATLQPGGRLSSLLSASADQLGRDDVTVIAVGAKTTQDKLTTLLDLVAKGRLRTRVAATVPLDEAVEALAAFRSGKIGKVLVTVR